MKRRASANANRYAKRTKKDPDTVKMYQVANRVYAKREAKEAELKFYDLETVGSTIGTGGTVFSLSLNLAVGTGESNRIGSKIRPKGLNMRYEYTANSSATYNTMRMLIFQYNSATPTVADVLQLTAAAAYRHLSQINMASSKRLRILHDETVTISDQTALDIPAVINKKCYIKLGGTIEYSGGGAGNEENNVFMIVISDSSVNFPVFSFTSRLRYTDS